MRWLKSKYVLELRDSELFRRDLKCYFFYFIYFKDDEFSNFFFFRGFVCILELKFCCFWKEGGIDEVFFLNKFWLL